MTVTSTSKSQSRFISLRWRVLLPIAIVVTLIASVGAYLLASRSGEGVNSFEQNFILQHTATIQQELNESYMAQRSEARRVAFTVGVAEAIQTNQPQSLQPILESLAVGSGLDSVIVTDTNGQEVMGLLSIEIDTGADYSVSTQTDLATNPMIRTVLDDETIGATSLLRTPEGIILYTAVPITLNDEAVGVAVVGQSLADLLTTLDQSTVSNLSLYSGDGTLLQTTYATPDEISTLESDTVNQVLTAFQQAPVLSNLSLDDQPHRVAYLPFDYGTNTLGVVGVFVPNSVPFATQIGRQLASLMAGALAGAVVLTGFVAMTAIVQRLNRVTNVVTGLSRGIDVRTEMTATDEIGRIGVAVDRYATVVKAREDKFRHILHKQRRELDKLSTAFMAIPNGVIVQDTIGQVLFVNPTARTLMGMEHGMEDADFELLTALVKDALGVSIQPGIYALGDPRDLEVDGRIVRAQAVAINSVTQQRIGTVILLQDISEQIRKERAQEQLLKQLSAEIQQSLTNLSQVGTSSPNRLVNAFAREISRYASTLQSMIVEMRDLTQYSPLDVKHKQRALRLETLMWAVANDWRQIAQAGGLSLHIVFRETGLYVLGDERRLRWAIGNIVDNAIKYNQPGGSLSLEIQGSGDRMARLRIRDSGAGIVAEDMRHVFVKFFRGTPMTRKGEPIRVPGMGQGLATARRIFRAHGGDIRLKSKLHVGTAAYFTIPLTADVTMTLPMIDEAIMEGETVQLTVGESIEAFWEQDDDL